MITNIRILLAACQELNIPFKILHPSENLVRIIINNQFYYFTNWSTPFVSQSVGKLFKDKDYVYELLKDTVKVPKTKAFLSPFCKEAYKKYLLFTDIDSIVEEIKTNFALPVIIKRNAGSSGNNVFLCQDIEQVRLSLQQIFNINSKEYDYVALAQEYIDITHEYRAIYFNNELLLLYEKNKANAKFIDNLSPLHWQGAKAIHITNQSIISDIDNFVKPICQEIPINYGGLDIAIDQDGNYWLIEINSHPGYEFFIRDNDEKIIIDIFITMLKSLLSDNRRVGNAENSR